MWGAKLMASWIEPNMETPILLVENNQDDILLILRAFQRAGITRRIQPVTSGMDAVDYLQGKPPYDDRKKYPLPAMVLLDIQHCRSQLRMAWGFSLNMSEPGTI